MRRLLIGGAITLAACLAFPAVSSAGTSPKATGTVGSPGNTANQSGGATPFTLVFTAQGSGTATNPIKGNFTFTRADGQWFSVANVTCLDISGNEAGFSGVITGSSGTANVPSVGQIGYAAVSDNGQGSSSTGPDMVQVDAGSQYTGSATACAPSNLVYTVTSGTDQISS